MPALLATAPSVKLVVELAASGPVLLYVSVQLSVVGVPLTVQVVVLGVTPTALVIVVQFAAPHAPEARHATKDGSQRASEPLTQGVGVHGAGVQADALPGLAVNA